MNRPEHTDLREALRRLEARRPQPEVPADFCDRVMKQIATPSKDTKARQTARRRQLWAMAAAASITLAVVLVRPRHIEERQTGAVAQQLPSEYRTNANETEAEPATAEYTATDNVSKPSEVMATVSHRNMQKRTAAQTTTTPHELSADSMAYLAATIEEELEQISDDCYMEHLERAINSDPQLCRMISGLIDADADTAHATYCIKSI